MSDDEQGFASLIIGAVLFVSAPISMVLAVQVWAFSAKQPDVVLFHAWLARIGVLVVFLTAILGISLDYLAIRNARRHSRPTGMAIAGLFLSSLALCSTRQKACYSTLGGKCPIHTP